MKNEIFSHVKYDQKSYSKNRKTVIRFQKSQTKKPTRRTEETNNNKKSCTVLKKSTRGDGLVGDKTALCCGVDGITKNNGGNSCTRCLTYSIKYNILTSNSKFLP